MTETTPADQPEAPESRLEDKVDEIYRRRFPADRLERKRRVWQIIAESWLSKYVRPDHRLLEVAAGYCEFLNAVKAAEKVAVDLNPETGKHAGPDVAFHEVNAENLAAHLPEDHFDVVLVSNFFEHCRSREQILVVLESIHRVTKPGGRILVLGPNFKYVGDCYYDYFDHRIALTEMSMAEAVELGGFRVEEMVARTLPYSFRSRLPSWSWLIRLYFQLPVFWPLFGKQFFVVGRK